MRTFPELGTRSPTTPSSTGRDFFNIHSLPASYDTRRIAPAQRAVRVRPLRRVLMAIEPPHHRQRTALAMGGLVSPDYLHKLPFAKCLATPYAAGGRGDPVSVWDG